MTKFTGPGSHERAERSVTVELLNRDEIYRADQEGRSATPIYKVVFYNYGVPIAHWPTPVEDLGMLCVGWIMLSKRPDQGVTTA